MVFFFFKNNIRFILRITFEHHMQLVHTCNMVCDEDSDAILIYEG